MKHLLFGVGLVMVMPVFAAQNGSVEIDAQFNGLDVQWEPFGTLQASDDQAGLDNTRAITLFNNGNQRALCEFVSAPDGPVPTAKLVLAPNDQAVLRVPHELSEGDPLPVLVCVPG